MSSRRVVLAPDKFKGSASAAEVAEALARGLARTAPPDVRVARHPIADGGEGTVELLLGHGWAERRATVGGPFGEPVEARWARRAGTAVVEASAACGLALLGGPPTRRTALEATTAGVGELVAAAVEPGVERVVVGIGGTATTDGGRGAVLRLRELGPAWSGVRLEVACDVRNPLLGAHGAAAVYAPQKGADAIAVRDLEERLTAWADEVTRDEGRDVRAMPGTGAGGGLAYGFAAALGATIVPGLSTLLDLTDTVETVRDAHLLVVGEGSLDAQSLFGKGPVALAGVAAAAGVPVVAVVGRSLVGAADAAAAGIGEVIALLDLEPDPVACMASTAALLDAVGAGLGERLAQHSESTVDTSYV